MIVAKVKSLFFDRKRVLDAVGKAAAKSLGKVGGKIRLTAQRSMRYRKSVPKKAPWGGWYVPGSPKGTPPFARKDTKRGPLLRKMLFYAYEPERLSVIIGPAGMSAKFGTNTVPHVQEFGGRISRMVPVKRKRPGRKASPAQSAAFQRLVKARRILLSKRPRTLKSATLPPRPYMGPALQKSMIGPGSTLGVWKDSVRPAA